MLNSLLKKEVKALENIKKESEKDTLAREFLKKIYDSEDHLFVSSGTRFLGAGLIPDDIEENISNIIKNCFLNVDIEQSICIDTKEILKAIKSSIKEQNINSKAVCIMEVTPNSFKMIANGKTIYVASNNTPNEFKIAFNLSYFINALEFFNGSLMHIGYTSVRNPLILTENGKFTSYNQHKYGAILPIRLEYAENEMNKAC